MRDVIDNIMYRQKVLADDVNSIILMLSFFVLVFFSSLVALMSIVVYPLFALLIYGIIKIKKGIVDKEFDIGMKILTLIWGICSLLFGLFMFYIILTQPTVGYGIIIHLIAFPILLIGIAGIVKGYIIKEYKYNLRVMNIVVGVSTIIFVGFAFVLAELAFLFFFYSLIGVLFLNMIIRSAMYLSDFGLSIKNLRNLKYVIRIINDHSEFEIMQEIEFSRLKQMN
jgi:hypothetical protein